MAQHRDTITIKGTVRSGSLDSICLSHRICIAAVDGHVYEVDPSYVGIYLESFVGCHVIARVQPVTNGKKRSVVRIWGLTVLNQPSASSKSETAGGIIPLIEESQKHIPTELEVGVVDA